MKDSNRFIISVRRCKARFTMQQIELCKVPKAFEMFFIIHPCNHPYGTSASPGWPAGTVVL